jgi:hypothetical protein
MKKYFLSLCIALSTLFASSMVSAANSTGPVAWPLVTQWGTGLFGVAGAGAVILGTKPACAAPTIVTSYWAVDVKTPAGRAMWALVMQAHALGKTVLVSGKGNCDIHGDRESVDFLYITD